MPQSSIASYIGDLPPESSNAYEVGAKFELFDGITADIALFDIHKRNVLYTESVGDETIAKTAGRVRSRGVEVDLREHYRKHYYHLPATAIPMLRFWKILIMQVNHCRIFLVIPVRYS